MKVKLGDIAQISIGLTIKDREAINKDGDVRLLQMSDINELGIIRSSEARIKSASVRQYLSIQVGDILFKSKGVNLKACYVLSVGELTTISAPLVLIRVSSTKVLPEYIHWYLNSKSGQSDISINAMGTNIASVNIRDLKELVIPVPDLKTQKVIAEIYNLEQKEINLTKRLSEKKQLLLECQLLDTISKC